MKITIDTKADSHDEIKKVISLLQTLLQGKETHSNIFDDKPAETSEPTGILGMFGSPNTEEAKPSVAPETSTINTDTGTLVKEEKKDDDAEIIPY